jgi:hypothetical protein
MLFCVLNHLGDLLGIGSARGRLRRILVCPNVFRGPKWFNTLTSSDAHLPTHSSGYI